MEQFKHRKAIQVSVLLFMWKHFCTSGSIHDLGSMPCLSGNLCYFWKITQNVKCHKFPSYNNSGLGKKTPLSLR